MKIIDSHPWIPMAIAVLALIASMVALVVRR